MKENAEWCIREAPNDCPFDVVTLEEEWYRIFMDPWARFYYGCQSAPATAINTLHISLPANVMNSRDPWNTLEILIWPLNFNNTVDCLLSDWYAQIVPFPPSECDNIDLTQDDVVRLQWPQIKPINSTEFGNVLDYRKHATDSGLYINATMFLGDRRYGDLAALKLQSTLGTKCNMVVAYQGEYPNGHANSDEYLPRPPHRFYRPYQIYLKYNATGHSWGLKGGQVPLTVPPDLTGLPENLKFNHLPDSNLVDLYPPLVLRDENVLGDEKVEVQKSSSNETARGLPISSCDPEILRGQLNEIRLGKIQLASDCDWESLYDVFFDRHE